MERPVQVLEELSWQIRLIIQKHYAYRRQVEKTGEDVPRKAAIVYMIPVP